MATEKTIEERIMEAVARIFHKEVSELSLDTRFVEDLLAKSINVIELTAVWEDEFGIEIPIVEARRAQTIGDAVRLVDRLLGK